MFPRSLSIFFKHGVYFKHVKSSSGLPRCGFCSEKSGAEVNVGLFFSDEVQRLLKDLTRPDLDRVFRRRRLEEHLEVPKYKFMTTKEVEQALKDAEARAEEKLKMPPVLPAAQDDGHVFARDPRLQGYSSSKFVFTDITFGTNDRRRTVVVRDEDGTLRKAGLEERARMNQLYFPRPGRRYNTPAMFSHPYLQSLLDRGEFEFVLERACAQFEPDSPDFLRVTEAVYRAVDSAGSYASLLSTRHYGPLVFYLATNASIDSLLNHYILTDSVEDAVWLVKLYHILHPRSASASSTHVPGKDLDFLQAYIEKDCKKRPELELTLRKCRDALLAPRQEAAL